MRLEAGRELCPNDLMFAWQSSLQSHRLRVIAPLITLLPLWACVVEPTGGAGGRALGGAGGSAPLPQGAAGGTGGAPTSVGGAGGSMGDGGGATFDCDLAPNEPLAVTVIPGLRGYHGLAIDGSGLMFGVDANWTLVAAGYDGNGGPFLGSFYAEQLSFASNGDLIANTEEGLGGVTSAAQRYTINASIDAYGLLLAATGEIFVADDYSVQKVDPTTGAAVVVVSSDPDWEPHSLELSPALDKLYVGMIGLEGGQIRVVSLDSDLNATGPLEPFVDVAQDAAWVDGIAADICGNVYATNFTTSQLFKITPAGDVSVYLDWSGDPTQYGHAVVFGNGKGGFREDAIYLPMPYNGNTVQEVVVGVPGRAFAGEVINQSSR